MELLSQVLISGITLGSLYALVGLGFVVIYRATKVVNFAQGEMMMLGAMLALYFYSDLQFPYFLAFMLAVVLSGVFGAGLERFAYRPLLNAPVVTLILATVAVGQMIRAGVRILRGSEVSRFPSILSADPFLIGGVAVTPLSLSIIAIAILLVCVFMLFFRKTKLGKGMEATSENREAALLVGISVNQTFSLVWATSSGLASARTRPRNWASNSARSSSIARTIAIQGSVVVVQMSRSNQNPAAARILDAGKPAFSPATRSLVTTASGE